MIHRCMVTLRKREKRNHWWITLKDGGSRIGVIYKSKGVLYWKELGMNSVPGECKTPAEGIARLLLQMNGSHKVG
jgi:hypothetical protein